MQFLSVAPFLVPVFKIGLGSPYSWVGKRGVSAPPGAKFLSFCDRVRNSQNPGFLGNQNIFLIMSDLYCKFIFSYSLNL